MGKYLLDGQSTERLHFRKVIPEDFEQWLPFYHHPDSTKYWEGILKDPKAACRQQFERIFERYEKSLGGMNALILRTTSEFVGMCGLLVQEIDGSEELEIGYSLLPAHWRQGYAIEAAKKCKAFAREKGLANSVISIIQVDNLPSQKVALKNGMSLEKSTFYKNNPVHIYRVNL